MGNGSETEKEMQVVADALTERKPRRVEMCVKKVQEGGAELNVPPFVKLCKDKFNHMCRVMLDLEQSQVSEAERRRESLEESL